MFELNRKCDILFMVNKNNRNIVNASLFMISAILPRDALTMFRLFLLTMYKISHFRLSSNIFRTMSRLSWSVSAPRLGCLGALGDEVAAAAAGLTDFWLPGTFSPRTCL